MSFVEGFYNFAIELTDADSGLHRTVRHKVPRHPYETDEYFMGRIVALLYDYEDELLPSQGYFNPAEPALWKRDAIGQILRWVEVGPFEAKKLKSAIKTATKHKNSTLFSVFFWSDEQIAEFCHDLKGTTVNWVDDVRFFLLEAPKLEELAADAKSSMRWITTRSAPHLYITTDFRDHELVVTEFDVWERYQGVIANAG